MNHLAEKNDKLIYTNLKYSTATAELIELKLKDAREASKYPAESSPKSQLNMAALTSQIWKFHPEEYLAIRADWVEKHPKATKALLKGLMEAQQWCDQPENRGELVQICAQRNYFNRPLAKVQ